MIHDCSLSPGYEQNRDIYKLRLSEGMGRRSDEWLSEAARWRMPYSPAAELEIIRRNKL